MFISQRPSDQSDLIHGKWETEQSGNQQQSLALVLAKAEAASFSLFNKVAS